MNINECSQAREEKIKERERDNKMKARRAWFIRKYRYIGDIDISEATDAVLIRDFHTVGIPHYCDEKSRINFLRDKLIHCAKGSESSEGYLEEFITTNIDMTLIFLH